MILVAEGGNIKTKEKLITEDSNINSDIRVNLQIDLSDTDRAHSAYILETDSNLCLYKNEYITNSFPTPGFSRGEKGRFLFSRINSPQFIRFYLERESIKIIDFTQLVFPEKYKTKHIPFLEYERFNLRKSFVSEFSLVSEDIFIDQGGEQKKLVN